MPIIGTELNVLSLTNDLFSTIPSGKKVMLRLFLNSSDQLTLAVWTGKDTDYEPKTPLFFLKVGERSGYKIKGDCSLGDQKIDGATIKEVKKLLMNNATYLVFFKPTEVADDPNQLAFEILVGDTSAAAFTATSFGLTKPSPPYDSKV